MSKSKRKIKISQVKRKYGKPTIIQLPQEKIKNGLKLMYTEVKNPYQESCKRYSVVSPFSNQPSNNNKVITNCVTKLLTNEAKELLHKQDWTGLKELISTAIKGLNNTSRHNLNNFKFVSIRYMFTFLIYHPNNEIKKMISEILEPYMDKLSHDSFLKKILTEHYITDNLLTIEEEGTDDIVFVESSESE